MKNLLAKIGDFVRELFSDIVQLLERKAPVAVNVTQKVKTVIEKHDGKIEWLTQQTATTRDDEAYYFIKHKLPKVAKEIAIIDGLVDKDTSDEEALQIYMDYLLSKKKESRAKEFIFLSAQILGMIIGQKAPLDLLVLVTQKAYRLIFKK